jgi:hypothetical protein
MRKELLIAIGILLMGILLLATSGCALLQSDVHMSIWMGAPATILEDEPVEYEASVNCNTTDFEHGDPVDHFEVTNVEWIVMNAPDGANPELEQEYSGNGSRLSPVTDRLTITFDEPGYYTIRVSAECDAGDGTTYREWAEDEIRVRDVGGEAEPPEENEDVWCYDVDGNVLTYEECLAIADDPEDDLLHSTDEAEVDCRLLDVDSNFENEALFFYYRADMLRVMLTDTDFYFGTEEYYNGVYFAGVKGQGYLPDGTNFIIMEVVDTSTYYEEEVYYEVITFDVTFQSLDYMMTLYDNEDLDAFLARVSLYSELTCNNSMVEEIGQEEIEETLMQDE